MPIFLFLKGDITMAKIISAFPCMGKTHYSKKQR